MNRKVIKYFFELAFIFVIPLLIICLNCNYSNTIEYDNNGNYQATEKHFEFTPPFSYIGEDYYVNYLHKDQLIEFRNYDIYGLHETLNNDKSINLYGTSNYTGQFPLTSSYTWDFTNRYLVYIENNNSIACGIGGFPRSQTSYITSYNTSYTNWSDSIVINIENGTEYNINNLIINVYNLTEFYGSNNLIPSDIDLIISQLNISGKETINNEVIRIYSDDIISINYQINYTIWGRLKNSFYQGLQLQDNFVLDIVITYTILWFTMFLIWHIIYLLFDKLFHLRRE